MRIFLAGAAGVIGRRLVPMLIERGHEVVGTTRSDDKATWLASAGAEPVLVDALDAEAMDQAVASSGARVVIHELTDLANGFAPDKIAHTLGLNARMRKVGTANLVRAALAASVERFVAQSIAWVYARGTAPYTERNPLDPEPQELMSSTLDGVRALEHSVLCGFGHAGVILRNGHLYGPGTGSETAFDPIAVHVDAAARAAAIAVDCGAGVYNIVEPNEQVDSSQAKWELAWDASFRAA